MDDDLVSSSPDEASMPGDLPGGGELPEIELYELDGIPLAYLPTGGSTILSLSFGVGRAHEPVIRGGMTHLAEHLILTAVADRLDQALDHSNGATEPFRVSFMIRGSPQVASAFLREICQAIERPAFHRMHEEGRVLRTERMGREGPPGMSTRTIALRAGHQGIGACHLPELFLEALDEEALRDWIARHLVAGNAAIWIAGELPSDLYVSLPPGPRTPPPQVRWIPGLQTPAIASEDIPGVAASFFVQRSAAARSAFRTLEARLRKALRVDRGLGYEVGTDYVPVSADGALATAWATCLPAAAHDVERVFLEIIDDLAARGASDDELHSQYERFARDAVDPMAIPARLDSHPAGCAARREFRVACLAAR